MSELGKYCYGSPRLYPPGLSRKIVRKYIHNLASGYVLEKFNKWNPIRVCVCRGGKDLVKVVGIEYSDIKWEMKPKREDRIDLFPPNFTMKMKLYNENC